MKKLIFAVLLFAAGCSKSVEPGKVVAADDEVQNATTTDTYLPLTQGTNWVYKNITEAVTEKSKLTVLKRTQNFNGKTYTTVKMLKDDVYDTVYYNQTGHNYYLYNKEEVDGADNVNLEILFLKDDAAVNTTWTQDAGSASGMKLKCFGKVMEKNISLTVNSKTYEDVIHTYIEIRKPIGFLNIVVYKQDYYVAKNIGIVKNVSKQLLPTSSTTTTNITNYTIK